MWTPDLYIVNLKTGLFHKVTTPNRRFRLSPNGVVYYGQCLSATMYCDMVLDRFPMDNQTCFLEMSSCEYRTLVYHLRLTFEFYFHCHIYFRIVSMSIELYIAPLIVHVYKRPFPLKWLREEASSE